MNHRVSVSAEAPRPFIVGVSQVGLSESVVATLLIAGADDLAQRAGDRAAAAGRMLPITIAAISRAIAPRPDCAALEALPGRVFAAVSEGRVDRAEGADALALCWAFADTFVSNDAVARKISEDRDRLSSLPLDADLPSRKGVAGLASDGSLPLDVRLVQALRGPGADAAGGIDALERYLPAFPNYPHLAVPLALRSGDTPLAARILRDAPGSGRERSLYAAALDLFRNGRPELAYADVLSLVGTNKIPTPLGLWVWWLAAFQTGRLLEATAAWASILERAPERLAQHLGAALAEAGIALGSSDLTEIGLRQVYDQAWRDTIEARRSDASRLREASGAWTAVAAATDAMATEPRVMRVFDRGRADLQAGDWDAAARNFAGAAQMAKRPDHRSRLFMLAARAAAMSDDGARYAARYAERSAELEPSSPEVWSLLVDLYRRVGLDQRVEAAAVRLADVLTTAASDETSGDGQMLVRASRAFATAVGDDDAGMRILAQAVASSPKIPALLSALAEHHLRREEWNDAAACLETAARQIHEPFERARIYHKIGEIYVCHLRQPLPALESFLVSFVCKTDDAATLSRLEEIYVTLDRFKDLVGTYDIAIEHARNHPTRELDIEDLLLRKAQVLFEQLDRHHDAAEALLEAIRLRPQEPHYVTLLVESLGPHVDPTLVREAINLHLESLAGDPARHVRSRAEFAPYLWQGAAPDH